MINLSTLSDLYHHMEWADAAMWKAILSCENAQTDEKLRDYLYHLHLVQRAFLRVWHNEARDTPYPTFDNLPSLKNWGHSYYSEAFAYLDSVNDEQITAPLPLPWADMVEKQLGRPPATSTLGETMLQVTLHSLYHRGQVHARLKAIGGNPPLADYIAWVWLGRPAPDWQPVSE
jgi:uncharacterized damage-inducible protein DinB